MAILVRNLKLPAGQPIDRLRELAARKLHVPTSAVRTFAPVRRALDARRHDDIHFVYHVELNLDESLDKQRRRVARLRSPFIRLIDDVSPPEPCPGKQPLPQRPIVVGFGPAGMFASLRLAQFGYAPIVLERGQPVRRRHRDVLQTYYRERIFNPESNLLFGEGGAGTYSDGKLYTRVRDPLIPTVLETLYHHGAQPDILTDARPHVGSDRLPTICARIRRRIESLGGEIRFGCRVDDVTIADGRLARISTSSGAFKTGPVLLAIGHSSRDTMAMLARHNVALQSRPFQLGVRIEHPQSMIDRWQYGQEIDMSTLPPAEYHLVAKDAAGSRRDCYSFCMCPGGQILPSNESPNLIATNGASRSNRNTPFANAGLVVTVTAPGADRDPLAGIAFQKRLESAAFQAAGASYRVPCQRAPDFLSGRSSSGRLETSFPLGGTWTRLADLLPADVSTAVAGALTILDRRMPGFAGMDAIITAPETRASSSVRILRDADSRLAVGLENLYPCGEGAGYAGGIVSSAIDGIRSADAIIARYAPIC